ncbi:uncharacterized protein LOC112460799 [Temnothorax curvispinosus]|uniref:Uncharacterized protein LOC112460799 n=1 Tax=Temnothorax curvispinosus TaxID=300111 RepID=A0A6J1QK08_9HYME|nr:uncharacterized protein LOC112460799 [Temnothorax curvispinosus]
MGEIPNYCRKKKKETSSMLLAARSCSSYGQAMKLIENLNLAYYVQNLKKLAAYFNGHSCESDRALYEAKDFAEPLFNLPDHKTTIFVGPTRIGKTQFALAHFANLIIIRGKQDWLRFNPDKTDGIVLDNI